jgi:alkylation response protein AidB-like acyl-CoA dehydrogenase
MAVDSAFGWSSEQRAIVETAAAFAKAEIAPHALAWDEARHFPAATLRSCGVLGFGAMAVSEVSGGIGLSRLDCTLVHEALAKACLAFSAYVSIHNLAAGIIDKHGNDDQRRRFLPDLVSMDLFGAYCLTEPGSGSDSAALTTRAVRDGMDFVLNGTKQFISGAGVAGIYIIMARTGGPGPKGISAFIVEDGTPGLIFGAEERKMGWAMQPTRQVILEDCRVPAANMIGTEGSGFSIAMSGLDGGRLNIAACSVGGAQAAMDIASTYATERNAFGQPLAALQSVQFKLADMQTELCAARELLHAAALRLDAGADDAPQWSAMAKRFATDAGFKVANDALQILGGYGYLHAYGVEKLVRDLRVHQILEGTNEIMRVIIARAMLR